VTEEGRMQIVNPPGWPRPKGYSNGVSASGKMVFVAGTIGWNPLTEKIESADFVAQFKQALINIKAIMDEAGAKPEHMARMTWFVTDKPNTCRAWPMSAPPTARSWARTTRPWRRWKSAA